MGWIRIHGGEVRCLGKVGTFGSNGWPVLTQSWACLLLAQIGDSARAQTVHGAYLTRPPAPGVQYQQQYLMEDKYLFPVATECMHALPCCEGEESASSSLLCTSPALSLFSLISLTFPTTQTTSTFSCSYSYSHSHWQQTASHSQAYSYDEHFHGHSQVYSYYYPRFRDQSQGHNDHYCCDGGGGDGCCY